jgi:hypothetical protein
MRRKTLDALLTTGGVVVAVVFLAADGLLLWGPPRSFQRKNND